LKILNDLITMNADLGEMQENHLKDVLGELSQKTQSDWNPNLDPRKNNIKSDIGENVQRGDINEEKLKKNLHELL